MAVIKNTANFDLNGNEIQNGVFQNLPISPENPKTAQFWFDTSADTLMVKTANSGIKDALNGGVNYTAGTGIDITNNEISLDADVKYASSAVFSVDSSTYVLTLQLKDQNGDNLGNALTVDLPIESVVVSGSYDSLNKKIVLTLQNGTAIDVPVAALIAGLQSEITSTNKLDADLVADASSTNKFVTAAEKAQIGTNTSNINTINGTLSGYGNIVMHNTAEFATVAQGALADSALQNSSDIITALGFTPCRKITAVNPSLLVTGGQAIWTITNSFGETGIQVSIFEVSTNTMVLAEIIIGAELITIKMNSNNVSVDAGLYRAVIIG